MVLAFFEEKEAVYNKILALLSDEYEFLHISKVQPLLFRGLTIDPDQHRVFLEEREVNLTNLGFGVLFYLAQCPRHVFTKRQIQEAVWKKETESYENTVQCIISGLRKKLKKYSDKEYIRTVRGVGYKFEIPEA